MDIFCKSKNEIWVQKKYFIIWYCVYSHALLKSMNNVAIQFLFPNKRNLCIFIYSLLVVLVMLLSYFFIILFNFYLFIAKFLILYFIVFICFIFEFTTNSSKLVCLILSFSLHLLATSLNWKEKFGAVGGQLIQASLYTGLKID